MDIYLDFQAEHLWTSSNQGLVHLLAVSPTTTILERVDVGEAADRKIRAAVPTPLGY